MQRDVTPQTSHTKGAVFRAFTEWSQREYGIETNYRIHERLPPSLRPLVDPTQSAWGLVVSSWYPDELLNLLLALLLEPMEEQQRLYALREGTRHAMEKTFRGIYRPLLRLLVSPQRCAKVIQKLWQVNYDTGTVTWSYVHDGLMRTALEGWQGHHPYRCEINRISEELILEMLGCKNTKSVRVRCVAWGDSTCGSEVTWDVARG